MFVVSIVVFVVSVVSAAVPICVERFVDIVVGVVDVFIVYLAACGCVDGPLLLLV